MKFTSEQRDAIRIAFEKIRIIPRYDLCWEQMDKTKNGEYVKIHEVESILLSMLRGDI